MHICSHPELCWTDSSVRPKDTEPAWPLHWRSVNGWAPTLPQMEENRGGDGTHQGWCPSLLPLCLVPQDQARSVTCRVLVFPFTIQKQPNGASKQKSVCKATKGKVGEKAGCQGRLPPWVPKYRFPHKNLEIPIKHSENLGPSEGTRRDLKSVTFSLTPAVFSKPDSCCFFNPCCFFKT